MNKALEFLRQQVGQKAQNSPSPLMRWFNPTLLHVAEGEAHFQYQIRAEMTNPMGILHGGMSAAIIDDVIGCAVFSLGEPEFYNTLSNTIEYMSAAAVNDHIIAEAIIDKKGNQLIHAQCVLWNEQRSRAIAKGRSILLKTSQKK
ncbi:PaaI family thioesterase [Roseivirga thermotolerans]|uniref:PaaI family thioesterase n=1 Tax=Roseivirga thermotolerans TaxID=1758176 RepID=UPI00273EA9C6|nr:PaaI family thioesterase [Roseivirga thermotolerans]